MSTGESSVSAVELDQADELREAVGEFVRAVRHRSDRIGSGQLDTLGLLARSDACSIAELARQRGVRHQSMRSMIIELEAAELVSRAPDPTDARGSRTSLTPAGRRLVESERTARAGAIALASRSLDARHRRLLEAVPGLLRTLTAAVVAQE
ncbi:MarR family winged helix-turn-helix transcriptional regulator [Williamsia sp. CHRR-6]|uniref:MarR family winged helix-turn-helix transcriptional regulator n=1 Tax=Williamsia sp. CHRR-6 TaxID=2835871 RepID=UPI001BD9DF1A|nr:MarR family transcriptional regulator [Williamsia sp. CHRR-6]MBT0568165.1 MarR family transcriptional regulator [Williamsia sp. CHRR-6]